MSIGVADDFAATIGMERSRIRVLYNSIGEVKIREQALEAIAHPWFGDGQPPVFLGVGRLHAAKGFDNLIRAFATVRAKSPCRLVIIGEGEERHNLQELAASLGVANDISMMGFVNNPYPYMPACAAFVLSSRREGLPTVLMEALSLGTKVIATDCNSGPREILENGRLGILVEEGDLSALATAMFKAIS